MFVHLSGLAFGVGGAWILDLYILSKMFKSPVSKENIHVISFVSKIVTVGLGLLWISGLMFILYYSLQDIDALANPKIWAKVLIVIVLTINGYLLHRMVLPILFSSEGRVLVHCLDRQRLNQVMVIGCISFITWPLVMLLGTFKSLNFSLSFIEIIACYLLLLVITLAIAAFLKSLIMGKIMETKVKHLQIRLLNMQDQLTTKQHDLTILTKAFHTKK